MVDENGFIVSVKSMQFYSLLIVAISIQFKNRLMIFIPCSLITSKWYYRIDWIQLSIDVYSFLNKKPIILLLNNQDLLANNISTNTLDSGLDSFIKYFPISDTEGKIEKKTWLTNLILFLIRRRFGQPG